MLMGYILKLALLLQNLQKTPKLSRLLVVVSLLISKLKSKVKVCWFPGVSHQRDNAKLVLKEVICIDHSYKGWICSSIIFIFVEISFQQ